MSIRKFIPLLDRILVKRVAAETKTASGLLLPETAISKLPEGIVIATGKGGRDFQGNLIPVSVGEGDRVMIPEFGGQRVDLGQAEGEDYVLFRDQEILGKLE